MPNHVEDVVETHGEERGTQLAGEGAGEERLAAPRRAVQQQATADVGTERLAQLRRAQRTEEAQLELAFDRLEAGDVAQLDPAALLGEHVEEELVEFVDRFALGRRLRAAERTGERGVGRGE